MNTMKSVSMANIVTTVAACTASVTGALLVKSTEKMKSISDKNHNYKQNYKILESELKNNAREIAHQQEQTKELIMQNRLLLQEKNEVENQLKNFNSDLTSMKTERENMLKSLASVLEEKSALEKIRKTQQKNSAKEEINEATIQAVEEQVKRLEIENKHLLEEINEVNAKLSHSLSDNREKRRRLRDAVKNNVVLQIRYYGLKFKRRVGGSDGKDSDAPRSGKLSESRDSCVQPSEFEKIVSCGHIPSISKSKISLEDLTNLLQEKRNLENRLAAIEKEIHNIRLNITPDHRQINAKKVQMTLQSIKNLPKPQISLKHISCSSKTKCPAHKLIQSVNKEVSSVAGGSLVTLGCGSKRCLRPTISPEEFVKPQGHPDDCSCMCCDLRGKLSLLRCLDSQMHGSMFSLTPEETLDEPYYPSDRPPSRSSRNSTRSRVDVNSYLPLDDEAMTSR